MSRFRHLRVGDDVKRKMGHDGPVMNMRVLEVREDVIVCGAVQPDGSVFRGGWEFDRDLGCEEDADLKWGRKFGITGTYLTEAA